ncbi:MAG: Asp-tRNA(Asn)/Glu-tRNA(Gln) amidotransferase subunit GatA, partial [Pyramidobacter sp.]|nr:Asp-tRNA(Asn)/Glu-tRNA(Gln) amidotransferase subunit GatA [Pyramidobacter sp.]
MSNAIVEMNAIELSQAIHAKKVSCREVMSAYLDHISAVNPRVNAIVTLVDADRLLKQADERDAELAAGNDRGWMHGFPQAVKDLMPTQGIRTTMGSLIFKDFVPDADGAIVSRMKRDGAIIIGKTNTPEFGYGSQTYNEVFGPTANPYDE